MDWKELSTENDFSQLLQDADNSWLIIFKHSPICPVSANARRRFESNWPNLTLKNPCKVYLVDVISQRSVSNYISSKSEVRHESPQLLVFNRGKCIFQAAHNSIDAQVIEHLQMDETKSK